MNQPAQPAGRDEAYKLIVGDDDSIRRWDKKMTISTKIRNILAAKEEPKKNEKINYDNSKALNSASLKGDLDEVKRLILLGVECEPQAMDYAASEGHLE